MAFCGNCGQETGREVVYKWGSKYDPATKKTASVQYPEPLYCDNCRQAMKLNDVSVPGGVPLVRKPTSYGSLYRRVFAIRNITIQEKAMMLALCSYADHETGEAFPSVETLAFDLCVTQTHARLLLGKLYQAGYLEKVYSTDTIDIHRLVFNPGKLEDLV